jgi:uncharacterized protein YkwD
VHHRPSSPPLTARIAGALTRWSLLLRPGRRRTVPARLGRLALGALVTTTVVGLVLAIPVMSGVGAPAVELDSSSMTSPPREGNSPVVMGMDGRPVSSADFAGVTTWESAPTSSAPESSPVASGPAAPADAPAVEPEADPAPPGTPTSSDGTTTTPAGSPSSTPPTTRPAPPSVPTTPAPAAPAEGPVVAPDPAGEVLALVNAERAALGCGALVADAGLAGAAQGHSTAMSASGILGLNGLAGAVAQGADAASVVAGWVADASGAGLLDCARTSAGTAVVDGWWTVLVA